jgi:hypothetical protein
MTQLSFASFRGNHNLMDGISADPLCQVDDLLAVER